MAYLNIDPVVDVVVSTAAAATPRDGFNVGLIIGKTVGNGMSETNRTITVTSLAEMTASGYQTTDPEYKAAEMYFAQDPAPAKLVLGLCVGTVSGNDTTYETWAKAIEEARASNHEWYTVYIADSNALSTAEIQAVASYVETITACFFFEDSTAADITNATTDVFSVLKGLNLSRTFGMYSTTKYAAAAAMGFAMGANDGTANSHFTMAYKTLANVAVDDLNVTQVGYLQAKNANYYVMRGATYTVLETGVVASGKWFDEVLGLDQLAYDLQRGCMDLLAKTRTKIPYTDAGAQQFVLACNDVCKEAAVRGFLAPGIWRQNTVLNLEKGDTLELGYMCQAVPVADRPDSEKSLRKCPPLYVCVNMAGAIHSATIKVNVQ